MFEDENEDIPQDVGENEAPEEGTQEDAAPALEEQDTGDSAQSPEAQTPDENAIYAAARRRAEAEAERKYSLEQDKLITDIFGGQVSPYTGRVINNKAEFDVYRQQYEREQQEQQFQQAGIDPAMLNQLIEQNPKVQQASMLIEQTRMAEGQRAMEAQVAELAKFDPSVKSMSDVMAMPTFGEFDRLVRQGHSITDAYKLANFDTLSEKRSAAAKQAALNAMNGKSHMTQTKGGAGDDVVVPAETLAMYRSAFPKWTEKQIIEDYKKHM